MRATLTFNDYPFSEDGKDEFGHKSDVAIVGCGSDMGAGGRGGQRDGPFYIRAASYWGCGDLYVVEEDLSVFEYLTVVDCGDSELVPGTMDVTLDRFHKLASKVVRNTRTLVTLGGDHSVLMPALRAVRHHHGQVLMIHFDAHADFWEVEGDEVHNHASPIRFAVEEGLVSEVMQLGLRGYGPLKHVFDWAADNGIRWWSMKDLLATGGMNAQVRELVKLIPKRTKVYLSIDMDVMDPSFAPGTGTPEPGGCSSHDLLQCVRVIAQSCNVVAADVVEVTPGYDVSNVTSQIANRCVVELMVGKALRTRAATG